MSAATKVSRWWSLGYSSRSLVGYSSLSFNRVVRRVASRIREASDAARQWALQVR